MLLKSLREEPKNQGAWYQIFHGLTECLQPRQTLRYSGRPEAAATATGSKYTHVKEQQALLPP